MQACADYGINFINMAHAVRHSLLEASSFLPNFKAKTQFMHAPLLDGLVTWASSLSEYMDAAEIQSLFAGLQPLPMVDIGYMDIPNVPSIRINNHHSMQLIVSHLVKKHHFRSIAFIGTRYSKPHTKRLEYFKTELAKMKIPVLSEMIFLADSLEVTSIAAETDRLLAYHRLHPIEAIVTSSDIIAAAVIERLEKQGVAVPDDLAVTGFNNQLVGITSSTPITTIDLAYFNRGYRAVEYLIDRIMSPEIPVEHELVTTNLIVRQSCGCFEHAIVDAMQSGSETHSTAMQESMAEIHTYLEESFAALLPQEKSEARDALLDAVLDDLAHANEKNNTPPLKKSYAVSVRC